MSGVFPVGCGSAAPREHINERRCILQKINKCLVISLFFVATVFFILKPVNVSAAVSKLDEEDCKIIRSFFADYEPTRNYTGGSTISHCTNYIIFSDDEGKSYYVTLLPTPDYCIDTGSLYSYHLPRVSFDGRDNNTYTFVYNPSLKAFSSTDRPFTYSRAETGADCLGTLCRKTSYIAAVSFDMVDKDGTVFFQHSPLPVHRWWAAMGEQSGGVKRQLLRTGKMIATVIILVVSYLIFPIFWKKCLESLLPS